MLLLPKFWLLYLQKTDGSISPSLPQVCEMSCSNLSTDPDVTDNLCSCDLVHSFQGGRTQSVLSKSALVPNPSDPNKLLVCAGDETSNAVSTFPVVNVFNNVSTDIRTVLLILYSDFNLRVAVVILNK